MHSRIPAIKTLIKALFFKRLFFKTKKKCAHTSNALIRRGSADEQPRHAASNSVSYILK